MDKKIFIVDDDNNITDMYSAKFISSGFQAYIAHNVKEALELFAKEPKPDVILLDIVMPGENGIELLDKIKSENLAPGAVIMILSNLDETKDVDEEMSKKIDGYFIKADVTPGILLTKVNEALEKHKVTA